MLFARARDPRCKREEGNRQPRATLRKGPQVHGAWRSVCVCVWGSEGQGRACKSHKLCFKFELLRETVCYRTTQKSHF